MAWLHELAEEIPREENEKTKDEGEDLAKSTLTVSLAQNDDDDDDAKQPKVKRETSKIEAKSAEETAVVDNVIQVASKEEVSVEEVHPVASAECDDDDDDDDDDKGMMESDGADFRNVNVKEMKACLVATKDDEKESRV